MVGPMFGGRLPPVTEPESENESDETENPQVGSGVEGTAAAETGQQPERPNASRPGGWYETDEYETDEYETEEVGEEIIRGMERGSRGKRLRRLPSPEMLLKSWRGFERPAGSASGSASAVRGKVRRIAAEKVADGPRAEPAPSDHARSDGADPGRRGGTAASKDRDVPGLSPENDLLDSRAEPSRTPAETGPLKPERGKQNRGKEKDWSPVSVPGMGLDRPVAAPAHDTTMNVIARRVTVLSGEAEDLASRGAYYAARAKMIESLRAITQALDSQKPGKHHSEALAAAKQAFREVGDFAPQGSTLEAELDLEQIISGHRTKVLKDVKVDHLTSLVVRQKYLEYAQRQFAKACSDLPIGSYALYGLGRVHAVMDHADLDKQMLCLPKAVTLHQAALLVNATNVQAANELGVLLARFGQLRDAERALRHALSIDARTKIWMNLAAVHERQGERQLARKARDRGTLLASRRSTREKSHGDGAIKWVDPKTFSETRVWQLR